MPYRGPQVVDLNEISALNLVFIRLLADASEASTLLTAMPSDVAERLGSLSNRERASVAAVPFLVFSLRERDDDYWEQLCAEAVNLDLLADSAAVSAGRARFVSAALGFMWQMSRRNPYTLRLISGASLHWCERLAEQPLMTVIQRASNRDDILTLRAGDDHGLWSRLTSTAAVDKRLRAAVQLSALQSLLFHPGSSADPGWRSAACRSRVPAFRVADDS